MHSTYVQLLVEISIVDMLHSTYHS